MMTIMYHLLFEWNYKMLCKAESVIFTSVDCCNPIFVRSDVKPYNIPAIFNAYNHAIYKADYICFTFTRAKSLVKKIVNISVRISGNRHMNCAYKNRPLWQCVCKFIYKSPCGLIVCTFYCYRLEYNIGTKYFEYVRV